MSETKWALSIIYQPQILIRLYMEEMSMPLAYYAIWKEKRMATALKTYFYGPGKNKDLT